MTISANLSRALWMSVPTIVLALGIALLLRSLGGEDPSARVAAKARRVDLVERLQLDLASASEAEKSAVLAVTDQESVALADQARAASARVEEEVKELRDLLAAGAYPGETELLARFSTAFAEYRRVDENLLALAVRNTNIKAYDLAFGPAALAVRHMNEALDRLLAAHADAPEAKAALGFALAAETGVLRVETLLTPHIAEESDAKMDALEAAMAREEAEVDKAMDGLARLPRMKDDADLAAAAARYAEFGGQKKQILALSRENTNVRSLSISLNEKRKVMQACQAALDALREAILAEPTPGVMYGAPPKPR